MGPYSIVLLVCAAFGLYSGWRNGWQKTLIRLVSFVGAYFLLYRYLQPFAAYIKQSMEFGFLLSHLAAGGLILILGGFAISIALKLLFALLKLLLPFKPPAEQEDAKPHSIVGGLLGGGLGGLFALFLVWALSLMAVQVPQLEPKADQHYDRRVSAFAQTIIGSLSGHVLAVAGAKEQDQVIVQALIRDPLKNAKRLRSVGESEALATLMHDRRGLELMRQGDHQALLKNKNFQAVIQEPAMQELLHETGLQAEGEEAVVATVSNAFSRMEQLRRNPKVMQLLKDPQLQRQIHSKDYFALFANPKFEQILEAFQNPDAFPADPSSVDGAPLKEGEPVASQEPARLNYPAPSKKIYHWVDDNGKHHYSDKKPD